jgi:hypothetical protein
MGFGPGRLMGGAGLLLLVALLGLPSANYQLFDGLPLSAGPELLALILVIPLLVSRSLRRLHTRWTRAWPRACRMGFGITAVVAVALKLSLFASGTHSGFVACYRSPLSDPPAGLCERSFENTFFRFAVTRIDPVIHFGERDWDLGFLNSQRFNFYPAQRTPSFRGPLRWRIPIAVTWQGVIERTEPWTARVTYVGEATIAVPVAGAPAAGVTTRLPPHYGPPATVLVPVPAGRHALRVEYQFNDGSRDGGPAPRGPWATFRMERGRGPDGREPGAPVEAVKPPASWRGLAAAADVAVTILIVPLLFFYARLLWRDWWYLALAAVAAPFLDHFDVARFGLPTSLGLGLLLVLLAVPLLGRPWRRRLVAAALALPYVALCTTLHTFHHLAVVTLREAGSDPLTYESQAHAILETWSLEGGEPVYFLQPAFRYIRFLERLVLGDGDGFVSIVSLAALYWAFYWAFARLWPRPRWSRLRAVAFASMGCAVLALLSSPPIVFFVQVSLSEYPTWIFLPLLFPLLFRSRSARDWLRGAVLVSLSCLTRMNQIPPLLAIMAVFARRAWPIRRGPTLAAVALLLGSLMLPAAHNLRYGGQLVWGTGNQDRPVNTVIPLRDLLRVVHDAEVRTRVWYQVDHMFYLHTLHDAFPRGEYVSWVAIHSIQILWLAVCLLTLTRRTAPCMTKVLLGLPLLYLGVHLVYVVDFYYPRHIIAGHLAMAVVALYAVGRGFGPAQDAPDGSGPPSLRGQC